MLQRTKHPLSARPPKRPFQVVSFGSHEAMWEMEHAKKQTKGLHIAVDPSYRPEGYSDPIIGHYTIQRPGGLLQSVSNTMEGFIDTMRAHGLKSKEIYFRMPDRKGIFYAKPDFKKLFTHAREILTKNGTITITTEWDPTADKVTTLAKEAGLEVSKLRYTHKPKTYYEKLAIEYQQPVWKIKIRIPKEKRN